MYSLVVLPVVGIGGIVHPYFEVLAASEKERTVFAELSRVAASIQVYNQISLGAGNEIL